MAIFARKALTKRIAYTITAASSAAVLAGGAHGQPTPPAQSDDSAAAPGAVTHEDGPCSLRLSGNGDVTAVAATPKVIARSKPILHVDGLDFKDLNGNGRLDPYEDWRLPARVRALDLVGRMTPEEKAGQMVNAFPPTDGVFGTGSVYDLPRLGDMIARGIGAFTGRLTSPPAVLAEQNNRLQEIGERSRLGIPITVSSDPRNEFSSTFGASVGGQGFTAWPDPTGLAAAQDAGLTTSFGAFVRQEYRAVGLTEALSPQADLATEPRWARTGGTFGEDAKAASVLVAAYVRSVQGGACALARGGVATVVKHWVGYGSAKDGWDSHNAYGRYATFPTHNIAYHLEPFRAAFSVGAAGVMPTYSILPAATVDGVALPEVGAGFDRPLLTDVLRGKEGFKGFVLSDFGIVADCPAACRGGWSEGQRPSVGMPWGMEAASEFDRVAATVAAGVDQIGGYDQPETIVAAVRAGKLDTEQVDSATLRVLLPKFEAGLFEDPYVDVAATRRRVGSPEARRASHEAQVRSLVLLKNEAKLLPLRTGARVYLQGVSAYAAQVHGLVVVSTPDLAEVVLTRLTAPHQELHPHYFFAMMQHEGDLDFKPDDPQLLETRKLAAQKPVVATIYLDRPAILTALLPHTQALIANFGVDDDALLDVVTGRSAPVGRLPFELPSSMEAVRAQASDQPHDSPSPLFPIHFGLKY